MEIKQQVLKRFGIIYLACLVFTVIPVAWRYYAVMVKEGDFWRSLGQRVLNNKLDIEAVRGNILSNDGRFLATTIPNYTLYMDYRAGGFARDSFLKNIDDISAGLAAVYHMPASDMKKRLMKGYQEGKQYQKLSNKRISFVDLQNVKQMPFFSKGANRSGLIAEENVARIFPFDNMGARTIGGLYAEAGRGRSGLEMQYDSVLRGEKGEAEKVYIGGRYRRNIIKEPVRGKNVLTTLDVDIMDVADASLRNALTKYEADHGCVVVMEAKTGAIRAMTNLQRNTDGTYSEGRNYAVSSQTQPGSTFKVASAIVLLENGVDTSQVVDTENGSWTVHGKTMHDWNYYKGGFGKISLNKGIQVSSNIAIARLVEEKYGKSIEDKRRFIRALYDMGLNTPLQIEIPGAAKPYIKNPDDPTWSLLSLPWISHGYELEFPPLNVLTFYNGLANNGKMIQPYLVKGIGYNGGVVEETERTKVINEQICSRPTLDKVRQMMIDVVEKGTAKNVHSDNFLIAGKTGTAVEQNGGQRRHQLTFCGFFPADKPQYSMIVVVWYPNTEKYYPSAGAISGSVFKQVAEAIYAKQSIPVDMMTSIQKKEKIDLPITKNGNVRALSYALDKLGIACVESDASNDRNSDWGTSSVSENAVVMVHKNIAKNLVPNVVGMGAKDAVYLLENRGLKVKLSGVGAVSTQSIKPGTFVAKGNDIELQLR